MKIRKIIFTTAVSALVSFGLLPGAKADVDSVLPNGNTADGQAALLSLTTGFYNSAFGFDALLANSTPNFNTGIGAGALLLNNGDPAAGEAIDNTAVGAGALLSNTIGHDNNGVGTFALFSNTEGDFNIAVGHSALQSNLDGFENNAVGDEAMLDNTSGDRNTAIGDDALHHITTGNSNVAIGDEAGSAYTGSETRNICIGAGTIGTVGESDAIRIGDFASSGGIDVVDSGPLANVVSIGPDLSTQGITILTLIGFGSVNIGNGLQTTGGASTCNIGGIYNQAFGPADMAVRIGSDNRLGTVVSSRRFKHDIKPLDSASEAILALRPVTFQYNSDTTNTPRVGLIAEDVAEVSRELVIPDKDGKPLSVRYEDVNVMLLNEFLKEHKKVEEQQANIAELKSTVGVLTAQLKEQAAQIQKVSAQLEVNKPTPQVVANKP
jgi:hypothetical protein